MPDKEWQFRTDQHVAQTRLAYFDQEMRGLDRIGRSFQEFNAQNLQYRDQAFREQQAGIRNEMEMRDQAMREQMWAAQQSNVQRQLAMDEAMAQSQLQSEQIKRAIAEENLRVSGIIHSTDMMDLERRTRELQTESAEMDLEDRRRASAYGGRKPPATQREIDEAIYSTRKIYEPAGNGRSGRLRDATEEEWSGARSRLGRVEMSEVARERGARGEPVTEEQLLGEAPIGPSSRFVEERAALASANRRLILEAGKTVDAETGQIRDATPAEIEEARRMDTEAKIRDAIAARWQRRPDFDLPEALRTGQGPSDRYDFNDVIAMDIMGRQGRQQAPTIDDQIRGYMHGNFSSLTEDQQIKVLGALEEELNKIPDELGKRQRIKSFFESDDWMKASRDG